MYDLTVADKECRLGTFDSFLECLLTTEIGLKRKKPH